MIPEALTGYVLDYPALRRITAAKPGPYAEALIRVAVERGSSFAVPAVACQMLIAADPDGASLLGDESMFVVEELTSAAAAESGAFLAAVSAGDDGQDVRARSVVAAHAVAVAGRRRWPLVTVESDEDLYATFTGFVTVRPMT